MPFGYDVYFSERPRNRIVRWSPDTGDAEVVAGEPQDGDQSQKLAEPYGLAFDRGGNLLIADKHNHRICRLVNGRLETKELRDVDGHRAKRKDSHPGYKPGLRGPTALWLEPDGSILCTFADDYVIYRIRPKGELSLVLGIPRNRPYHFRGIREIIPPAELGDTPLNEPTAIVGRPDGTLYFVERKYQVVREYHPARGLKCVFPLNRQRDLSRNRKAPKEAKVSDFHPGLPAALALDARGRLYVCDIWYGCIMRVEPEANRVTRVLQIYDGPAANSAGPVALGFGPDGIAWVLDTMRNVVEAYDPTSGDDWKELGDRLSEVRGRSLLQLSCSGSSLVAGTVSPTSTAARSKVRR